jgi:hypothetical protein
MTDAWAIGDVQGYLEPLLRVLGEIGVCDAAGNWSGGASTLVQVGDLVDRGPDGIGVIDLLMRLQAQAASVGGRVDVVLGNHDVFLLAARRFGHAVVPAWLATGGVQRDLDLLGDAHVAWLAALPAMLLRNDVLFVHADALLYLRYGPTVHLVNRAFARVLHADDLVAWESLLEAFSEHRTFVGEDGEANLNQLLGTYGAKRLVHGHSPIAKTLGVPPATVKSALVTLGGRCVSIDPGMYLGGPGFAYPLN